jgi:predicted dienelactone hydrolase
MKSYWLTLSIGLALAGFDPNTSAHGANDMEAYKKTAGPYQVDIVRYDWLDTKRDRKVPAKIYYPESGDGPFPVIIFSHGLGGSREGYEYLGRHWTSHGYVSVHLQHLGGDNAVWEGAPLTEVMQNMRKSAADIANATNRPLDVKFAIDQVEKMNENDPALKKRLDLARIGVAGHSFGAYTVLAIAGETFVTRGGQEVSGADPRVKAAIPMSAPLASNRLRPDAAFAKIKIPCLHMTGTKDTSPIGMSDPSDRRVPFDHIKGSDQFLITFKDGDHMIFSGRGVLPGGGKDDLIQSYIKMSSIAFWDAYLKGDAKAKTWLTGDGFSAALGSDGAFEKKLR